MIFSVNILKKHSMFNNLNKIKNLILRKCMSSIRYARFLGVEVGNDCTIQIKNWGTEPYLISIGNNVGITQGVRFHTHGGSRVLKEEHPGFATFGKIRVNDYVFIGTGAQIMPGVTIGKGSLVSAGSIVTKSVPEKVVVGGNPARIICTIEEFKERNLKYNLGCRRLNLTEKKLFLLSLPDDKFISK